MNQNIVFGSPAWWARLWSVAHSWLLACAEAARRSWGHAQNWLDKPVRHG